MLFKNHKIFYFAVIFNILVGCKLQEPLKTHGIVYLENRSEKLIINKSNKNDVIQIFGQPQVKSQDNDDTWVYIERILSKGKYHKLGKHVVKENNVLVLQFNKYGILFEKNFLTKEDINKIAFSSNTTDNELTKKSFVENFLQSVKQKMYGNR